MDQGFQVGFMEASKVVSSLPLALLTQNLRSRFPSVGSFEQGTAQGSGVTEGLSGVGSRTHEIEVSSNGLGRRITDLTVVVRGSELRPPPTPGAKRASGRNRAATNEGKSPGRSGAQARTTGC